MLSRVAGLRLANCMGQTLSIVIAICQLSLEAPGTAANAGRRPLRHITVGMLQRLECCCLQRRLAAEQGRDLAGQGAAIAVRPRRHRSRAGASPPAPESGSPPPESGT